MKVSEGKELIEQLKGEIEEGKDVKFNKEWIKLLNKSILKASIKGFNEVVNKSNKKKRWVN